jgi:hypothetical protein
VVENRSRTAPPGGRHPPTSMPVGVPAPDQGVEEIYGSDPVP